MIIIYILLWWTVIGALTVVLIRELKLKMDSKPRKLVAFLLLGPIIWTCAGLIYFIKS